MPGTFEVELITPESVLFQGSAERLSVPGVMGSLGILAGHAPLLTQLKVGEASLLEAGGGPRRYFYIGGGFMEVNRNHVTILAEDAAAQDSMDPAEAERLYQVAQENLSLGQNTADEARARLEFQRAEARLAVIRRNRP